ncbi:MAG: ABC transporter ATP-binding protein [Candidatus Thorarchaeota archaeon]|nr:ABC transporter ATP-binding protein [Candidatus Thorarchaeota archaeon]
MVRVELRSLSRVFADGTRIGPIDLTIEHGELMTLLGPSGAGKTTTLRMVAGFIRPDSGNLLFDDKSVLNVPPRDREIGMVFQSTALFPNMNVFQNISFSLDMAGWPFEEVVSRVEELADLLNIRGLLNRHVNEISGGEAQRVALARALARNPRLLLLDEPLSALDPQLRERLQAEIRRIQKKLDITALYVTHSQEEAFAMSDKIAVLRDGVVVQVGEPEALYEHPQDEFVAQFIGDGNVFEGTIIESQSDLMKVQMDGFHFTIAGDGPTGERVTFAIKPEDISVNTDPGSEIEGVVQSVVPRVGVYRVTVSLDGCSVVALIDDVDLAHRLRAAIGERVSLSFDPRDAIVIRISS